MKRTVVIPFAVMALLLTGCTNSTDTAQAEAAPTASDESIPEPAPKPLDLTGDWEQSNSNSKTSYQEATIDGDTISINWVNDDTSTKAIYWVGTYVAPEDATDTYSWTSEGDTDVMAKSIMGSQDEEKDFTFEGGKLRYELSAMGVTMTVEMEPKP